MARDRTSITKRSRREGVALHPKAHKIMVKRKNAPGYSPSMRYRKISQYGAQLREKQKVKRIYGLLEKQFRNLLEEAEKSGSISGEKLLELLERRLDNAIYRLQLAPSRQAARQLVTHGHFRVNGKRVNVPSYRLSVKDDISIRDASKKNKYFQEVIAGYDSKSQLPSWLSINKQKTSAKVTGLPKREEAEPGINENLIIEFYSR